MGAELPSFEVESEQGSMELDRPTFGVLCLK